MYRFFFPAFFLLFALNMSAQTMTQRGVAYRYNGKYQRTPLGNVAISYDSYRRSTLSGEQDGLFTLMLPGLRMGERIGPVTVKKREMMVFNQHAVDEWSIRKDPLVLILCNADEFERQKESLINIGRREAKKKYDRQKAEFEAQLNANKMQQAEYEAALDKAYEDLKRYQKSIGEYADLFARIDESEVDSLAQKALELFHNGEIDAAIQLFEQGSYMNKLKQARKAAQQGRQAISTIQETVNQAEKNAYEYLQSLKAQIEAYKMQGEWSKAGTLLHQLTAELETYEAFWDYAEFCYKQNDFKQAQPYYEHALQLVEAMTDKQSMEYLFRKSKVVNRLANLCQMNIQLAESEKWYLQAKEIREQMAQLQPEVYEGDLAQTIDNMGTLYRDMKDLKKSTGMHLKALEMRERLYASQPEKYGQDLLWTLGNLGNNYLFENNLEKCKDCYSRAIVIGKYLQTKGTANIGSDLAALIMQQGVLYDRMQQADSCIACYQKALAIFQKEADKNPYNVAPLLSRQFELIGVYYSDLKNYEEAVKYYRQGIELIRSLVNTNPLAYEETLSKNLDNQTIALLSNDQLDEAFASAEESVALHSRMEMRHPGRYTKQKERSEKILSLVKQFIDAKQGQTDKKE